ncbi:MAG: hypothetical protein KDK71_09955, partial [Chlamydiia bacterium]|nr:hypothetical protein [Chlamydiia bacterium]
MRQSTCMMDKSAVDIQKLKKEWASDKPFPLCSSLKETLPKTYIEPLPFWSALFKAIAPSLSSIPFETYPLYDDCVTRHLDANPIALKILGETEKSWTYREIDTKVTQALPFLRTLGPTISLPLSHSLDFLILFLGAIKLGKTLNFLSPATQL